MELMTQPVHSNLLTDIHSVDSGIDLDVLATNWGNLITLTRQGQKTRWRVWVYDNGELELTHNQSATLPPFKASFTSGQYDALRNDLLTIIERGYV